MEQRKFLKISQILLLISLTNNLLNDSRTKTTLTSPLFTFYIFNKRVFDMSFCS